MRPWNVAFVVALRFVSFVWVYPHPEATECKCVWAICYLCIYLSNFTMCHRTNIGTHATWSTDTKRTESKNWFFRAAPTSIIYIHYTTAQTVLARTTRTNICLLENNFIFSFDIFVYIYIWYVKRLCKPPVSEFVFVNIGGTVLHPNNVHTHHHQPIYTSSTGSTYSTIRFGRHGREVQYIDRYM